MNIEAMDKRAKDRAFVGFWAIALTAISVGYLALPSSSGSAGQQQAPRQGDRLGVEMLCRERDVATSHWCDASCEEKNEL